MEEENKINNNIKSNKGRFIPYIFFIFFGIIFCVDAFYVYIANKSWRGLYTENAYQKGLKYNETLEYVNSQKSLGLSFKTSLKNEGKNISILKSCFFDKNKNPIKGAKLVAKIMRPTQEGHDFSQDLNYKNNCYEAKINFPLKGLWNVEIIAYKDDKVFQEVKRYVVE